MASLSLVNNVKSLSNDGIRVFESLEPYLQPSSRVMASTIAEQINGLARKSIGGNTPSYNTDMAEGYVPLDRFALAGSKYARGMDSPNDYANY
ncbi:hypothetical protein BDV59DRAFT_200522 [Aspergillus ambiguus]|uniref:uncharacterized protein n=1 Tax=Aspergillus ambiguus TaxID=176160 RepID=UPI003CCDD9B4